MVFGLTIGWISAKLDIISSNFYFICVRQMPMRYQYSIYVRCSNKKLSTLSLSLLLIISIAMSFRNLFLLVSFFLIIHCFFFVENHWKMIKFTEFPVLNWISLNWRIEKICEQEIKKTSKIYKWTIKMR